MWPAQPDLIRCGGRQVTDTGQHTGQPCTRIYRPHGYEPAEEQARAAGWAIGRLTDGTTTATCPTCRQPSPETTAAVRALEASLHRGATT